MPCIFASQNIVDIKNVITVLVIISVILNPFAWLGENAARVP
jgi:hypothetical protein